MERILRSIDRPVYSGNNQIENLSKFIEETEEGKQLRLILPAVSVQQTKEIEHNVISTDTKDTVSMSLGGTYIFTVRQYMTKKSSIDFDFQLRWNNNIPMPLRTMKGKIIQETRGMYKMDCHGIPLNTSHCMKCGRVLTNPVSRLYGIGPECGGHFHINPFDTNEELQDALKEIENKILEITWTGWVIKSAITEWHKS